MKKKRKTAVACYDKDWQEHEVKTSDLIYRPSVYGIMIEGDKVLVSPLGDGYDLPGGGVNIDESLEEALVREYREETGLIVRPLQVVYASTSFFHLSRPKNGKHWNCPMVYYLVEKIGGRPTLRYAEEYEKKTIKLPVWLPIDSLDPLIFHNFLSDRTPEVVRLAKKIKKIL